MIWPSGCNYLVPDGPFPIFLEVLPFEWAINVTVTSLVFSVFVTVATNV